jgi:hypothetical protein
MRDNPDMMVWRAVGFAALATAGALGCAVSASPPPGWHEEALEAVDDDLPEPALDEPAPFAPLHVLPDSMKLGAPPLLLRANPTVIDTTALTINGETNPFFFKQDDYALLFTNTFTVLSPVKVIGASSLIVVAEDRVVVSATIDLSAVGPTPGPGALSSGPGAGGAGQSVFHIDLRRSSGGGGGGHGLAGAAGGTNSLPAGAGGATYGGMGPTAPLVGGSRGGDGGFSTGGPGAGGGGGGALQISSAISIHVTSTGEIKAAGGGGRGGGGGNWGGGGGGSGGQILLEAPQITVNGKLTANGGGGGGGGTSCGSGPGCPNQGLAGQDGGNTFQPAAGGISGDPQGSPGGAGGSLPPIFLAKPGSGFNSKGGGGGGGAGRIWLRHRAGSPPVVTGSLICPQQFNVGNLP